MANGLSSGTQRPSSDEGYASATASVSVTAIITGRSRTAGVGATRYAAIMIGRGISVPPKPTSSVSADETGMSVRRKLMFATIERRTSTARSELITVIMISWNGTTAQAT